jgi:PmbA protein
MDEDLLSICRRAVKIGEGLGADEIEVFVAGRRSIDAGFENNEMKMAKQTISSAAGIRVFRKKSLGFASVNSLEPDKLGKAIMQAIALSKDAPPDENNELPAPKPLRPLPGLYDEEIASMSEEEVLNRAKRMLIAACGVDPRVSIDGGRFEAAYGSKAIANSLGVEGSEDFSTIYYDIGAHAVEGGNVSSIDYRFDGARNAREDDSERIAVELAGAAIDSLTASKLESHVGSVIFSPLAAIEMLLSPILFSVDSSNVQKGVSKFKDKMGERVTAEIITITDDGTISGGLSSSAFDREGVPHSPLYLIRNGNLGAFLHDAYTAKKAAVESNGHAAGSPMGVPSVDATNIRVVPGAESLEQLVSSIKRGLLVQRFSGRVDPVSGDFSGVAKGSKGIEGGSLRGSVKETLISGNVYDVLARVRGLSRETKRIMDFDLPHFAVDDISITGGSA